MTSLNTDLPEPLLGHIVNLRRYPLHDEVCRASSRATLNRTGALVLPEFLCPSALASLIQEAATHEEEAHFSTQRHTVYLTAADSSQPADHPLRRQVVSSKGCICDDILPHDSVLRPLYNAPEFRDFLCAVLGEKALYPYADSLSSINIHYAQTGQELGWHFDNSSFAITLMIQSPTAGGQFEYLPDLRDSASGDMNFDAVRAVLDGEAEPSRLDMTAGTLVLFRGRNAIHRVAPNQGKTTRMLAVLAYNTRSGISLSEQARQTFYGRLN